MRISVLTIGAIASILSINSVFATTSTVTSKDYVDAADALKQNKIPATGTNAATPGTTVVTYTGTAGQIGERGIFNYDTDMDWETGRIATGHEGDLVTAGDIIPDLDNIRYSDRVVTYKTCYETDSHGDCILWNLGNISVYGNGCKTDADCPSRMWCDPDFGRCQLLPE